MIKTHINSCATAWQCRVLPGVEFRLRTLRFWWNFPPWSPTALHNTKSAVSY